MNIKNKCLILVLSAILFSCSSSKDNDDLSGNAKVQLYNLSLDSSTIYFQIDDEATTYASFGNVTSVKPTNINSHFIVSHNDDNGERFNLYDEDADFTDNHRYLFILHDGILSPQLTQFSYQDNEVEEEMSLLRFSQFDNESKQYDWYISSDNTNFDNAELITSSIFSSISDAINIDYGSYKLYVTETGSQEVILETASIPFTKETKYFLNLRRSYQPSNNQLIIDVFSEGSSTKQYADINQTARFRIYNSIEGYPTINASLGSSLENIINELSPQQVSDYIEAPSVIQSITITDSNSSTTLIDRLLLSLDYGQSPIIAMVPQIDEDNSVVGNTVVTIENDERQLALHNAIHFANLTPSNNRQSLYFVSDGETIESTSYKMTNISFGSKRNIKIPNKYFDIFLIDVDEYGNQFILAETNTDVLEHNKNYLFVSELSSLSPTGIRLNTID